MFGKFFASTFTGSMFGAGSDVFAVWGYVIANTFDSTVELNPIMVAAILGTTPAKVTEAIEFLCRPDPASRNKDQDGRRLIHENAFQYHVVSHELYRAIRNEEDRRAYNREKQRESRARRKSKDGVKRDVNDSQSRSIEVNDVSHGQPIQKQKAESRKQKPPEEQKQIPLSDFPLLEDHLELEDQVPF